VFNIVQSVAKTGPELKILGADIDAPPAIGTAAGRIISRRCRLPRSAGAIT
jgi:hypothetical protein